jgi:hypothetical protein
MFLLDPPQLRPPHPSEAILLSPDGVDGLLELLIVCRPHEQDSDRPLLIVNPVVDPVPAAIYPVPTDECPAVPRPRRHT